jgi:hypothetical protein
MCLFFSLASVVTKLLQILQFFTKYKLQNTSGTDAATWRQKLAADFPLILLIIWQIILNEHVLTVVS